VTALWDTTVLSRIEPTDAEVDLLVSRALSDDPVRVAAPAVLEVAYGRQLAATRDRRHLSHLKWLRRATTDGTLRVVPLTGRAAFVAGRLRAKSPAAPSRAKRDKRTKPMRQAAWLLDIQVAATAFAAGLDVATANLGDFQRIADLLAELYPAADALGVVAP
jgi:predicted nucleic acid-binding protein